MRRAEGVYAVNFSTPGYRNLSLTKNTRSNRFFLGVENPRIPYEGLLLSIDHLELVVKEASSLREELLFQARIHTLSGGYVIPSRTLETLCAA